MSEDEAEKRVMAAYLAKACRGRGAARPKGEIFAELKLAGCRMSWREFDQTAHDLVEAGEPVGSSDAGFFWMVEDDDFALARAYLVTRFGPMKRRIEAIERMQRARASNEPLLEQATS